MVETTSALEASDCIFEDEDGGLGGSTPDATIFHVGTRTLSFRFLADAVDGSL